MLWSAVLAAGALADDAQLASSTCRPLLDETGSLDDFGVIWSDYSRTLMVGLMLAAGRTESEVADFQERTQSDRWGFGWDMPIEGFPRAPAMNRNQTANIPAVIDGINAWAVGRFPAFIGPEEEPAGMAPDHVEGEPDG